MFGFIVMKVSIVTVCYNSSLVIRSSIDSVLSQSYTDIEYIIVDGGSNDGTLKIVNQFADQIQHVISEPDKGIYDAMNKGVELATGDIIGVLNSDDFYSSPDVISEVVNVFKHNEGVALLFGNVDFVSERNLIKPVRKYSSFNFSPWKMRFGFMPAHPATFIKKAVYNEVGLYKVGYKIAADFDMFIRVLVKHKFKYTKLDKTLVRMRLGGASTSGFKSYWVSTKEIARSLNENGVYSNFWFVFLRLPIKFFQLFSPWG
ncbi:glycosyltransferase family 2 protein [Cycloclasticus pugetii]|jgi:glycosyltransferase involved in cell wall biosynthesis|uniref:glycosyltransferase family 2 protein n=1 Tax=Cycloclasticus pugetii TaxID=34068 RepID=UPI000910858D|nr:glycosyltransferase family 2 protein [Cycloclasticus pugetii]SHI68228.1 Glycosyltransferase involved in cell wall bisynthesis [Cycloclasticus pugetii]